MSAWMAGLAVQLVFFFLFVVAAAIFHVRIGGNPTEKCNRLLWKKHMWSLYVVSVLVFVRSLVRLIEYGQGWTGYILSHEVYLYVFDALLMFLSMLTMNWVHPSEVAAFIRGRGKMVVGVIRTKDVTSQYQGVQMRPWT